MGEKLRVIRPEERKPGDATSAMNREEAIRTEGMWAGFVRVDPGEESGWHHHGDFETAVYILSGALRMDFGPRGAESVVAQSGDFLHIPKETVHREINTSHADPVDAVVARAGSGPAVINVEGPEG